MPNIVTFEGLRFVKDEHFNTGFVTLFSPNREL